MKKLHFILVGVFTAGIAHCATVSWGTNASTGIITTVATGSVALQVGNWIQIGYFATLSNAQITTDASTRAGTALLAADFVTFSSGQVNATQGAGGLFLGNQTNTGFANQQIYLWALQSQVNTSLSTAEASVLQQAIAYVPRLTTPTIGAAWNFPSDPGTPITIDAEALTTVGKQILAGTFIPNANNASLAAAGFGASNNALQLATVTSVPEPSTLTFGALAALAAAGARRRRRE